MLRTPILALGVLALSGCEAPPISGGSDSGVKWLSQGMSFAQARAALGPQTAGDIRSDLAPNCITWVYDETIDPRYIHAIFEGDSLVSARDNFNAPCTR